MLNDVAEPESELVPGLREAWPEEHDRPDAVPRRTSGWQPALLGLSLLLLAAAVTMGVAAGVLQMSQTWESSAAVRFVPTGAAGVPVETRVAQVRAGVPFLTGRVTERAEVPRERVRSDLAVRSLAYDELLVTARAATAAEAEQLARVAVVLVVENPQPGLTAEESAPATRGVRTAPTLADALLTGGFVGAVLVVLVLTLRHIRVSRAN